MQHVIMKLALINVSKHIRDQVIKIEAQNWPLVQSFGYVKVFYSPILVEFQLEIENYNNKLNIKEIHVERIKRYSEKKT